jgi:hypothetical protein
MWAQLSRSLGGRLHRKTSFTSMQCTVLLKYYSSSNRNIFQYYDTSHQRLQLFDIECTVHTQTGLAYGYAEKTGYNQHSNMITACTCLPSPEELSMWEFHQYVCINIALFKNILQY